MKKLMVELIKIALLIVCVTAVSFIIYGVSGEYPTTSEIAIMTMLTMIYFEK